MNCPADDTIEAYLDDSLDGEIRTAIESHLDSCVQCLEVMQRLTESDSTTSSVTPEDKWPTDVAERMTQRVELAVAAESAEDIALPSKLADYELLEKIGQGGMGVVYRARQKSLNRDVAIKLISSHSLHASSAERFHIEARSAAMLDHPGIVPVFDVGQHGGYLYYAMAFVDGQALNAVVASGPLDPRAAATIVMAVAEAVDSAHRAGIIHRDLKPSNILLDTEGRPRVTDFGLAKRIEADEQLTVSGEVLGTPAYMPPEQAEGSASASPSADIYGLGAVLYFLLTGKPPFAGASPSAIIYNVIHSPPPAIRQYIASVSRDLETITGKCMEKVPGDRYASAFAVAEDLRRFLHDEPIAARPIGKFSRAIRWCRKYPRTFTASVAAATIVGIGIGTAAWFAFEADRSTQSLTETRLLLGAAEQQVRSSATTARQQAQATLETLASTIFELQPVISEDPAQQARRRTLLMSAIRRLDNISSDLVDPQLLHRCHANALFGLAEVASQLADDRGQTGITASRQMYLDAIEQFGYLTESEPENLQFAEDLARAMAGFGNLLADAREWQTANQYFQQALPILERVVKQGDPGSAKIGRLAELEVFCGEGLLHTGHAAEAIHLFRRARARCEVVLKANPGEVSVRNHLLGALMLEGDWYLTQNQPTNAEDCFVLMRDHAVVVLQQTPGDTTAIMDHSTAYERLGDTSFRQGHNEKALTHYVKSMQLAEVAGRTAPNNDEIQWDVTFADQKLADLYRRVGDTQQTRIYALKCVQARLPIAKADPRNRHVYGKLFHALAALTSACRQDDDVREELKWLQLQVKMATEFQQKSDTKHFAALIEKTNQRIESLNQKL